jgi:hypothetical protein
MGKQILPIGSKFLLGHKGLLWSRIGGASLCLHMVESSNKVHNASTYSCDGIHQSSRTRTARPSAQMPCAWQEATSGATAWHLLSMTCA